MIPYENGHWYGFNGGKFPLHHRTEVEIMTENGIKYHGPAEDYDWHNQRPGAKIIAFRVIKEHREAREFWAAVSDKGTPIAWSPDKEALPTIWGRDIVLFREVMPDE